MSFSHNNNLSYYVLHPLLLLKHALIEPKTTCTGCPAIKFPLCFHYFLGFHSSKLWKLGVFWKIQEICYIIGIRIFKIDSEIAEIIEVKVGNHHFENYILLLHRGRKIIHMLKLETLTSIISAISDSIFKIFVPIMQQISWIFQNYPNFCN